MRSVLDAWAEHDTAHALHAADRDAIAATESARSLVVELFTTEATGEREAKAERDLWSACARLGALLAERGASPSLAGGTIDGAARALLANGTRLDARRVETARASLVEGYVGAVREAERAAARAHWDYPACVTKLTDDEVAIACGHPADDDDALGAWAAKIAARLSKAKVRRATLSGKSAAKAEVASALALVGIDHADADGEAPPPKSVGWLRQLWRR